MKISAATRQCPDRSSDVLFRPGVQADGVLATCGRFLGSKLQETLLGLQPDVFEPRAKGQVNFLIFRFFDLHGIHPPGVARDRLGILDLLDLLNDKRSSAAVPV